MDMGDLNLRLEEMERQGVELERSLRECKDGGWPPHSLSPPGGRTAGGPNGVSCHSREGGGADAAGVVRPAPRQEPADAPGRRALPPVSRSGCRGNKTKTRSGFSPFGTGPLVTQDDAAEAGGEAGGRGVRAAVPPQQAG